MPLYFLWTLLSNCINWVQLRQIIDSVWNFTFCVISRWKTLIVIIGVAAYDLGLLFLRWPLFLYRIIIQLLRHIVSKWPFKFINFDEWRRRDLTSLLLFRYFFCFFVLIFYCFDFVPTWTLFTDLIDSQRFMKLL